MKDTILELLRETPFKPFELRMSNGDNIHVRHPEMALVTKSNVVVAEPESDRLRICAMLHISDIQVADGAAS